MNTKIKKAKNSLDLIIRKSRVHLYKPIQIAEILYKHRTEKGWNLSDIESYRNISKKWRDAVSVRLVGRVSTSSQKFQDNLFEKNAVPSDVISILGNFNKKTGGVVEAYIYAALAARINVVYVAKNYVLNANADTFKIQELIDLFVHNPGLKRSIDKMYEIAVYALFATIVRALRVSISIEIKNKNEELLADFSKFITSVLGIDLKQKSLEVPAALYRVGVTNAADRGLDMWTNFGPVIQVKHLTLDPELVENIAEGIAADRIIIVSLDAERDSIAALLEQVGWGSRIQGIITLGDLSEWYSLCLSKKYRDTLGRFILTDVLREFESEFPSIVEIEPFMKERGYDQIILPEEWRSIV
jgi:hypothetical protein